MSLLDEFRGLILEGTAKKAELIANLDLLKNMNTTANVIVSDSEYTEILALINASSLS